MLTDQWYVRTAPLAAPAVKAVEDGEINSYLSSTKTCTSRGCVTCKTGVSLVNFGGVTVSAWYDNDGKVYVGRTEEEVRERNSLSPVIVLKRDADDS